MLSSFGTMRPGSHLAYIHECTKAAMASASPPNRATVSIIGTAERKGTERHLNKTVFSRTVAAVERIITEEWKPDPGQVELVSEAKGREREQRRGACGLKTCDTMKSATPIWLHSSFGGTPPIPHLLVSPSQHSAGAAAES